VHPCRCGCGLFSHTLTPSGKVDCGKWSRLESFSTISSRIGAVCSRPDLLVRAETASGASTKQRNESRAAGRQGDIGDRRWRPILAKSRPQGRVPALLASACRGKVANDVPADQLQSLFPAATGFHKHL